MHKARPSLKKHKRIVIKIGSNVIASQGSGLDEARLQEIAEEVSVFFHEGTEIFLVSSGSILCGIEKLGLSRPPKTIPMKQASAAVGQSRLMWAYERFFKEYDIKVAQVLLTQDDIADRRRFINARNTLMTLLERNIIPIINENDTVTVDEIKLGDNDSLAAQVLHLVDASLLIALSDVDGLYTEDPRKYSNASVLPLVEGVTDEIKAMAGGSSRPGGTGGMATKVKMAGEVSAYGGTTLILNGTVRGAMKRAFQGDEIGTLFLPKPGRNSSKKHWISYSLKVKGKVLLDSGAVEALRSRGRSLLPSGILSVEGRFETGDAILCLSPDRKEIAKGLTNYNASEMIQIKGLHSTEIEKVLGYKGMDEVIHRDNMVMINDTL
ncbi:MAG: glutamate 5-kinase [Nitrospiria bacterium]